MGSKSSSKSSNATTTTNTDRRQVVDQGAVGISTDNSTVTVNNSSSDPATVKAALDAIVATDATNGQGFTALLGLADKLFTGTGEIVSKTQDTALAQIDRLNTAANDTKGAVDQKTLIILAVAGVGFMALRKK